MLWSAYGKFLLLLFISFIFIPNRFFIENEAVYEELDVFVTAYSSTPNQTDDTPFITASGDTVRDGIVACPYRFPFGTPVVIDQKEYECQDRMNRRYEERFDIWMPTKGDAIAYGIQQKRILVRIK